MPATSALYDRDSDPKTLAGKKVAVVGIREGDAISSTAKYGDYTRGPRVITSEMRTRQNARKAGSCPP